MVSRVKWTLSCCYKQTVLSSTITFAKKESYPLNCHCHSHHPPPVSTPCFQSLEEFKEDPVTFEGLL